WENVDYDSLFGDPGTDFWSDFTDFGAGSGSNNIFDHNNPNGFVDLTDSSPVTHTGNQNNNHSNGDTSNMPLTTRKRRASASLPHPPSTSSAANALPHQAPHSRNSNKRPRTSLTDISNEEGEGEEIKVDAIDLVDIDDDTSLSRILEQQQAAAIKAQSQTGGGAEGGNGSIKLSNVTCIICMESMTDMTVTHCGHLFCHTCIMEALIAGENQGEPGKGTSKCPVCRKKVTRPTKERKSRDKRDLIPLEIKCVTRSSLLKGKAVARG
ncbi:MAG: hypothetical protein Q9179_005658, partial [Wetmoreana sp. 5 TL-2023]